MKEKITLEMKYKKWSMKIGDWALPKLNHVTDFDVKEAYILKAGAVERTIKNIDPSKTRIEELEFQDIRVYLKPVERIE